jgi:ribonuclease HI
VNQTYRIFTDGSAIGNPGPGGWGVVVIQGKERWEMSGAHPWTTISEMELVAAVQALRSVEGRGRIELHSDSEYLIYGMCAFVARWQRQGWRNRRGTELQHRKRLLFPSGACSDAGLTMS